MKNTQITAVMSCTMIMAIAVIAILLSMPKGYYAIAFISIFIAISSFVISLLMISRARCMAKMLKGEDLIASWVYSESETLKHISETKEANRGMWVMAMVVFSFVIIVVAMTIGFAAETLGISLLLSIVIVGINALAIKLYTKEAVPEAQHEVPSILRPSDEKKRYVYLSSTGIYAHGALHMWKGWGSDLKEISYAPNTKELSMTYSYLRPYAVGQYTVVVTVPEAHFDSLQKIKEQFLGKVLF